MPYYDITQITRTRLRYTVYGETLEEAVRNFKDGASQLADDETLDVCEQFARDRSTDEDVTEAWDDAEDNLIHASTGSAT